MKKEYLNTSFSLEKFEKVNDEFLKCTVAVMSADGQVANGTKFSKESIDDALPTLNYCPVIGYFNGEKFTDHGIEYVISNDGFNEIVKTIPFGVAIKDSARYADIPKDNGETEKYLVCDVYLWSRYSDAVKSVKENKCNQSMEVMIQEGEYTDSYYAINKFNFSGLCILGEDVTPAFNLAKIRTSDKFDKDEFKSIYTEMTKSLDKFLSDGGEVEMDNEEVEQVEVTTEPITDETTEDTADEEFAKKKKKCEEDECTCDEDEVDEDCPIHGTEDEDSEEEEFENEESNVDYQSIIDDLNGQIETLKADYTTLVSEKSTLEDEITSLREYKSNIEKQEFEAKVQVVIDKFIELSNIDGYNSIFEKRYEYSLEELETKLKVFAFDNNIVLGKKQKNTKEINKGLIFEKVQNNCVDSTWSILDKYKK